MASCDFIVGGARVIDGNGGPSRHTDVAVDRDRIVDIGNCDHWLADRRIDAQGLVLAPGFIDSHTHDDLEILKDPTLVCKLSQGVTSVVAGNCGISLAPLQAAAEIPPPFPLLGSPDEFRYPEVKPYRDKLAAHPGAVNLALLAGHSSLRLGAMTDLQRSANEVEIEQMRATLRLALQQGCIGLSTGLTYPPAEAASTDEVVQMAAVLREFDGAVYATHMRDEGDQVIEAVTETLEIGSRAEVPVIISHHKCAGTQNHGRSKDTLAMIDRADADGRRVSFDVYPYTASATSLLPQFVRGAAAVMVAESSPHPEYNGIMLERIAADWECSLDQACERLYPASAIYFEMDDADLERILSHPLAMIGSDGIPSMRNPHPRTWGTFPRVLGHYVREKKLFDLETAVHKMTALSARRFGLADRGSIAVGHHADLVLFDADAIVDRATFADPRQTCDGIVSVWVNGKLAWHDDAVTDARGGQFLTH